MNFFNKSDIETIMDDLRGKLEGTRLRHTQGVMYTAASLAMRYGYNIEKAMLAGLLHDCAKYPDPVRLMELCGQYGIIPDMYEEKNNALIHARLGAAVAQKLYHVEDTDVLEAITYHTTGRADMNLLEKIIYVADYIEPHRKPIPHIEDVRREAFQDLDLAVYMEAEQILSFLRFQHRPVHPNTLDVYRTYAPKRS